MDNCNSVANVLLNVETDFASTDDKDTINKIYRQARIWVRFQLVYARVFTQQESWDINNELKKLRWNRLEELGYNVYRGGAGQ